jgi:hypothetical protein
MPLSVEVVALFVVAPGVVEVSVVLLVSSMTSSLQLTVAAMAAVASPNNSAAAVLVAAPPGRLSTRPQCGHSRSARFTWHEHPGQLRIDDIRP